MDKFRIRGGRPLEGEIAISGSKNSALPALAACLLTGEPVKLNRIPPVRDIGTMQKLLQHAGARLDIKDGAVTVCAQKLARPEGSPYDLVKTMLCFELGAGAASGANRTGASFHAGWMRDRRAAD